MFTATISNKHKRNDYKENYLLTTFRQLLSRNFYKSKYPVFTPSSKLKQDSNC